MTWGAGDWRACQKSEPGGLLLIDKVKEGTQKTEKFLQMHFKKRWRSSVKITSISKSQNFGVRKWQRASCSYETSCRDSNDICVHSVINKQISWKFYVLLSYSYWFRNIELTRIIYVLAYFSQSNIGNNFEKRGNVAIFRTK